MAAKFEVRVDCEPEHVDVRGYAMASGDDAADEECEEAILRRLDDGDQWAWCCVKVTVTCGELSESEYLGCCSYADEEDFRTNSGCFDDMVRECKDRLIAGARAVLEAAAEEG